MNKSILFIIVLVIVFVVIAVLIGNRNGEEATGSPQPTPTPTPIQTEIKVSPYPPVVQTTVNITDSGFSPDKITIKAGDTVRFVNQGSRPIWPASAVHPTHEAYPGSSIAKCGIEEIEPIFDACRGIAKDESFSFTFDVKGTWFYHDHLNPSFMGKVIVQ